MRFDKRMDIVDNVILAIEDRDNNLYRTYFNTSPIPRRRRKSGFRDANRYAILQGYDNTQLVLNTTKRVDILNKELAIQSKSLDYILKLAKEKTNYVCHSCHSACQE
jgi:hypothetical protein